MQEQYQPELIEQQTQELWQNQQSFRAQEDLSKEKFYCLSMFPYPSGKLHMGHVRNYTIGDVIARYQLMLGKNVLQPMGWDAFGLPAENAAIKHQVPPAEWTYKNIKEMREQFQRLGFAYDWEREITTCDPNYYRWEQWFFTKLFEQGLVYKKAALVNWDPVDQTILANEQVVDGRGWRSGALVERREVAQWFLKITAYADQLLADLDQLEHWPEEVKTMQRHWIGRSEGLSINFLVADTLPAQHLTVFTTRPDTLWGVSYLAIAPQHPLALHAAEQDPALQTFLQECATLPVAEAALATLTKRGYATGHHAIHPLTGSKLPIWVANFVVMDYGTGAVMAVPAHDQRDFEFAQQYHLPITPVVMPPAGKEHDFYQSAYTLPGILSNSGPFTGLESKNALSAISEHISQLGYGERKINYRLRDWSISRQRYWGTPVPIIYCPSCGAVPVPTADLPVVLPEQVKFSGATSPLKDLPEFYQATCPQCQSPATRETDTFDTFMESSWYYARFACNDQAKAMLDDRVKYWTPVDQYVGGIEHAVMHLLYARFYHKLLRDQGLVNTDEPFTRLLSQGMVLKNGSKMSKSKGNTVDPQALINQYGADTVRLFMMFAAPPEQALEWSDSGVEGAYRFLKRLWAFAYGQQHWIRDLNRAIKQHPTTWFKLEHATAEQRSLRKQIHELLQQARYDMERQQFNTVVSASMKLLNLLQTATAEPNSLEINESTQEQIILEGFSILLRLLAPITPHITHALWQSLGFSGLIINAKWPKPASDALKTDSIEWVVQINGKLRAHITSVVDADRATLEASALQNANIQRYLGMQAIKKIIIVPNKLINIVV